MDRMFRARPFNELLHGYTLAVGVPFMLHVSFRSVKTLAHA